jgi:hypothetical protein
LTFTLFKDHSYVAELEPLMTSPDGFRQLFCLFGRNSQGIGTSPLSIWVENVENLDCYKSNKSIRKELDLVIDNIYEKVQKSIETNKNALIHFKF